MANLKYKPDKDSKAKGVTDAVDEIVAEDFLPLPLQITRLAVLRDGIRAKIAELKAGL